MEAMRHCVATYLRHIGSMEREVRDLEWRIDAIRAKITGLSRPQGSGRGSDTTDKLGEGLGAIEELQREWHAKASEYAADIAEAAAICPPSHIGKHALWLHFVEGMPWQLVGQRLGYSRWQARRIAEGGICDLYHEMPETWRRDSIPDSDGGDCPIAPQDDDGVLVRSY